MNQQTGTRASTEPSPRAGNRRTVFALVGAGGVVVVVTAIVLVFGVIPLPNYPSLIESPDTSIPGTIAFIREIRETGPCLFVVPAAGGQPREIGCEFDGRQIEWGGSIAFTPDGNVVLGVFDQIRGIALVVIDPETGALLQDLALTDSDKPPDETLIELRARRMVRADGTRLLLDGPERGIRARNADGSERGVLVPDGPRDYGFVDAQFSPDGDRVLARDTEQRLIIVGADGVNPKLLATDATDAAWYVPGYTTYTVDVVAFERPGT